MLERGDRAFRWIPASPPRHVKRMPRFGRIYAARYRAGHERHCIPRAQWPEASLAGERAFAELGFHDIRDQNGVFTDGYFLMSLSNNRGQHRVSTAMAYLDTAVRSRANLTIMADADCPGGLRERSVP